MVGILGVRDRNGMDHQHCVGVRDQLSDSGVRSTTCIIMVIEVPTY